MFKSYVPALLLTVAAALLSRQSVAQYTPTKWEFYFEAGPKISDFRTTAYGGTYSPQSASPIFSDADRKITVRNTFSGFMQVKAFKPLSERIVLAGTLGLDMQHLNYKTGYTQTVINDYITSYEQEHISRLLTRARADWGIYYRFNLGTSAHLMPGVAVGQMVNLSQDGYSYTFIQPGLYFTNNRLLLSATVSDTPYNVLIPGASRFEGELNGPYTYDAEYRIREFQLSVGAKF
ncbi:hypothetical protein MUN82_21305 [Hymenobacter aerilatus]|uniref:Outer membrane protein beta-barrel domain-containing protein n=1 Tax=Hymenobacter aerilatus TaxID=2932251 RepID=A0A8T9SYY5_9BACT|nr:hypothetical protein [Hymenobacter aerilatus]UOR05450.1 hypothetical protein MUN82_21305 [Hymenobacter aerilatus]